MNDYHHHNVPSLENLCLTVVIYDLSHPSIGSGVAQLYPKLKNRLLSLVQTKQTLTPATYPLIANRPFLRNLTEFYAYPTGQNLIRNEFLRLAAVSAERLETIDIVITSEDGMDRDGVSQVLAHHDRLRQLKLIWTTGVQANVMNRVSSEELKSVVLVSDGGCPCTASGSRVGVGREIGSLGANNKNITSICLSDVYLDLNDVITLFNGLSNSLEEFSLKLVRSKAKTCRGDHAFDADQFAKTLPILYRYGRALKRLEFFTMALLCVRDELLMIDEESANEGVSATRMESIKFENFILDFPPLLPPSVTELALTLMGGESEYYLEALGELPNLTHLHITFPEEYQFLAVNPSFLNGLFTVYGPWIRSLIGVPSSLCRYLSTCPNLTELKIWVRNYAEVIQQSSPGMLLFGADGHLTEGQARRLVSLSVKIRLTDQSLRILMENLTNSLTTLDLSYQPGLTDQHLMTLMGHCQSLEVVDVSVCPKVSEPGLLALVQSSPNLSELNAANVAPTTGVCGLSDTLIHSIAAFCPKLRTLFISDGPKISQQAIADLQRRALHKVNVLLS